MDEKLKRYLEKCSPATVDQSTLDDLRTAMEQAVPEIAKSIRQQERLAAHFRMASSRRPQSRLENHD